MNKKNIIIIIFFTLICITLIIFSLYYNHQKNLLFSVNTDGDLTPIEQINPLSNNYTNIYVEGENYLWKYKIIYTLDDNKVINCRYNLDCFNEQTANDFIKNNKENEYYSNIEINKNIVTYNDNLSNNLTKEQLLESLKSANIVTIF